VAENQPLGFEAALEELERRVRRLEGGDVPLDEALALYEEGMQLARACQTQLEAAEARVASIHRGTRGIEDRPVDDVE
jgi:exodeoxyribonuclease VII small subunit